MGMKRSEQFSSDNRFQKLSQFGFSCFPVRTKYVSLFIADAIEKSIIFTTMLYWKTHFPCDLEREIVLRNSQYKQLVGRERMSI